MVHVHELTCLSLDYVYHAEERHDAVVFRRLCPSPSNHNKIIRSTWYGTILLEEAKVCGRLVLNQPETPPKTNNRRASEEGDNIPKYKASINKTDTPACSTVGLSIPSQKQQSSTLHTTKRASKRRTTAQQPPTGCGGVNPNGGSHSHHYGNQQGRAGC